ncbi:MAG: BatA domain-containing protein [Chitinophagales bacterium]|nr:BatA domain-containing protein [Chitinophagales bacterium]
MSFLFPGMLLALLAVGIPLVVHLFAFRRYKTIYFPSVRFLREVTERTDARRRLRHLLVLISRMLLVVFLALAFAQPFLKQPDEVRTAGRQRISIYIDNSFSMEQAASGGTLLDEARARAKALLMAYQQDDLFQVLTNDFSVAQQQWLDRDEALKRIDDISLSAKSRTLQEVLRRQQDALSGAPGRSFLISDFQKNLIREMPVRDSLLTVTLIPLQASSQGNLFIDTCWMYAPVQLAGQPAKLYVRLRNLSDQPVREGRLTLVINDAVKAISDFAVEGGASRLDTLWFTLSDTSWNRAAVTLTDHPITFDDAFYFTFPVQSHVKVLEVSERQANAYVQAVFSAAGLFRYEQVQAAQLQYDRLRLADFIIVSDLAELSSGMAAALRAFLEEGGNVAIFPPSNARLDGYNSFFQAVQAGQLLPWRSGTQQLSRINAEDEFVRGVFSRLPDQTAWPQATGLFAFQREARTLSRPLWSCSDGSAVLVKVPVGRGWLFISALPLSRDHSDWVLHPLFAPVLFNMAAMRAYVPAHAYPIGAEGRLLVKADALSSDAVLQLRNASGGYIPPQRREQRAVVLFLGHNDEQPGFYEITDAAKRSYGWVAFNHNRSESDFTFLNTKEIAQLAASLDARVLDQPASQLAGTLSGHVAGISLWKLSLILALLFLLLETALLKVR